MLFLYSTSILTYLRRYVCLNLSREHSFSFAFDDIFFVFFVSSKIHKQISTILSWCEFTTVRNDLLLLLFLLIRNSIRTDGFFNVIEPASGYFCFLYHSFDFLRTSMKFVNISCIRVAVVQNLPET